MATAAILDSSTPKTGENGIDITVKKDLLVTSPYTDIRHLLDLSTLDFPYQYMAKALTIMHPLTPAYSTAPYSEAFNWLDIVAKIRDLVDADGYAFPETSFYIIVFRSCIPPTTDRSHLGELDAEAHQEAVESGGLLKYWFGSPDEEGRNLATCVWRNRDDARSGGAGKGHARAMQEVRDLYTEWHVERLRLILGERAVGHRIVSWVD